jgi:hypothetical protein
MLTLLAASGASPLFSAAAPQPAPSIRYVTGAAVRINPRGGDFTATVWATDQPNFAPGARIPFQGFSLRIVDRPMRDEFVAMFRSVRSGRGRMTIELSDDGKTIETLRLDVS